MKLSKLTDVQKVMQVVTRSGLGSPVNTFWAWFEDALSYDATMSEIAKRCNCSIQQISKDYKVLVQCNLLVPSKKQKIGQQWKQCYVLGLAFGDIATKFKPKIELPTSGRYKSTYANEFQIYLGQLDTVKKMIEEHKITGKGREKQLNRVVKMASKISDLFERNELKSIDFKIKDLGDELEILARFTKDILDERSVYGVVPQIKILLYPNAPKKDPNAEPTTLEKIKYINSISLYVDIDDENFVNQLRANVEFDRPTSSADFERLDQIYSKHIKQKKEVAV